MPVTRICQNCGRSYSTPACHRLKYCGARCYDATKSGSGNPNWKGGKIYSEGYTYVYAPKHPDATKMGYVLEHRLVMEKKLGRRLRKSEIVHHKDENRSNNKSGNLELFNSYGKHVAKHHVKRDGAGRFKRH